MIGSNLWRSFTGQVNTIKAQVLATLAASNGASLIGFIRGEAGAAARTLQAKGRDVATPQDFAAVADAAADDTAKVQAALDGAKAVTLPAATGYKVTALTLPANADLNGAGRQSPVSVSGTGGIVAAAGSRVRNVKVSAPGSAQIIYAGAAASDVLVQAVELSNDATAAPNGHGVQVNVAGADRWTIVDSRLDTYNFGVLLNTTAGGSKGFIVSRNQITTQIGDAIEVNSPATAIEDVVIAGNVAKVAAGSGVGKGIGIGLAHVNGAAVVGNILQRSWLQALHIEDGCVNATVVGNVGKSCKDDGVQVLMGAHGTKAVPIIGNVLEADAIVAGKAGVRVVWDGNGTVWGASVIGNVVRNFESGLWLGGESSHFADGNVIDSCTYAIQIERGMVTYTRQRGTNFVKGACTALLYVSFGGGAMVQAGRFVCEQKPASIILKAAPGTARPGCSVEGFSWQQSNVIAAGATTWGDLFPVGARFKGRITVQAADPNNQANSTWYTAEVMYDGAALTVLAQTKEDTGNVASVTSGVSAGPLRVNAGSLQYGWFNAAGVTLRTFVEFDGLYAV